MSEIPAGTYRAKAVSHKYGTANTGTEQVGIDFEIVDGDCAGLHVTGYFYFTEKAKERTFEVLRVCGWKGDDLLALDGLGSVEVDLVMKDDTYQGVTRAKVAFVNPPGGGGVAMGKQLDKSAAQSFAERMRASVIASKKHERSDAPASPAPTGGQAPRF